MTDRDKGANNDNPTWHEVAALDLGFVLVSEQ